MGFTITFQSIITCSLFASGQWNTYFTSGTFMNFKKFLKNWSIFHIQFSFRNFREIVFTEKNSMKSISQKNYTFPSNFTSTIFWSATHSIFATLFAMTDRFGTRIQWIFRVRIFPPRLTDDISIIVTNVFGCLLCMIDL